MVSQLQWERPQGFDPLGNGDSIRRGKILEEIWTISEVLMMWEIIRRDDWCLIRSLVDPLGSQQRMFASLWDHNRGVVEVYSYDAAKLQTNDDRTWVLKTWSIVRQSWIGSYDLWLAVGQVIGIYYEWKKDIRSSRRRPRWRTILEKIDTDRGVLWSRWFCRLALACWCASMGIVHMESLLDG